MGSIEEKNWFTNRQVVSLILFSVVCSFYVTYAYFQLQQQQIKHKDDIELLRTEFEDKIKLVEKDLQVTDNRLSKYIKRFYEEKEKGER